MLFQGDAPEESDTFQWPVIERDRVGGLRLIIWDKVKVPLCQYRLMHRKRVTSELHDSYFRLMTIKHSISKLETRCGRESHTRPRGPSKTPMEWTPASGEQERHNVTVITEGSKCYSLCSVSSSLSHATLEQPFRTLAIKWEVYIIVKEVFLRLYSSCDVIMVSLWCCMNMLMTIWHYKSNIYVWPIDRTLSSAKLRDRMVLGSMTLKGYSAFPKTPASLNFHHQIV